MQREIGRARNRDTRVRLVGHPLIPIGMGEHLRSTWRALNEAGVDAGIVDVYGPHGVPDPELVQSYGPAIVPRLGDGVNIFCLNGDEIEQAFDALQHRNLHATGSTNVIYPAWELPTYPEVWAKLLELFDEVWAQSRFTFETIRKAVRTPVVHLPLSCEVKTRALLSRRYFGIRESAYAFLFSFDFLSYVERKNPFAVIEAFQGLVAERAFADVTLIIKTNHADQRPEMKARFDAALTPIRSHVVIIDKALSDREMKALVWLADCYVSLHRAEGFGFGVSEAMSLGKPVITTSYSGNMDFCNVDTARLVPFTTRALSPGEYPHWEGQYWADPDIEVARHSMCEFVDDPELGRLLGKRAQNFMRQNFSNLAIGLRYADRIRELEQVQVS